MAIHSGPLLKEDSELRVYEHMTHTFSILIFKVLEATKSAFRIIGGSEKYRVYDIGATIVAQFVPYEICNDPVTCVLYREPRVSRTTPGVEGAAFSVAYDNQSAIVELEMWFDNLPTNVEFECGFIESFQALTIKKVMSNLSAWTDDESLIKTCRKDTAISLLKSRDGNHFTDNDLLDFGNEHGYITDDDVKILSDALNLVRKQGYRV